MTRVFLSTCNYSTYNIVLQFWLYQLKLEYDPKLAKSVLAQLNKKAKELGAVVSASLCCSPLMICVFYFHFIKHSLNPFVLLYSKFITIRNCTNSNHVIESIPRHIIAAIFSSGIAPVFDISAFVLLSSIYF